MATTTFYGLNNVMGPMGLGLEWLTQADNINVDDGGGIARRDGYSKTFSGAITGAHATFDFSRLYVVDGGALKAMTSSSAGVTLSAGLSSDLMHWAEVNDQVFFNNGTDSGIIEQDNTVRPWAWTAPSTPVVSVTTGTMPAGLYQVRCAFRLADGRITGPSAAAEVTLAEGEAMAISGIEQASGKTTLVYVCPANSTVYGLAASPAGTAMVWNGSADDLGADLNEIFSDPLPTGCDVIQIWRARAYAAQYVPSNDSTVIWYSKPMGFHLFNLARDFIVVPGRVRMMAPHDTALVIGTDQRIYAYDGMGLVQLAPYGVIPGWHWSKDEERVLFWSSRGLCQFPSFSNLTEKNVSVAPGARAGGTVVLDGGQKRYLVAIQQGGTAFNPYQ